MTLLTNSSSSWMRQLLHLNLANITNDTDDQFNSIVDDFRLSLDKSNEPLSVGLLAAYACIFVVAVTGNVLVLVVVIKNKGMRTVTNCFLLNLSIADLLVATVCVPLTVGEMMYKIWLYGEFLCKISGYVQGVSICASVLTLVTLCVDRFLAIKHPVMSRRFTNNLHTKTSILIIWIVAFGVTIPIAVARKLTTASLPGGHQLSFCHEDWKTLRNRQIYDSVMLVCVYFIPGAIVIALYSNIGCHLLWGNTVLRRQTTNAASSVLQGRRRVARMLIVLAILFALSWLPYHSMNIAVDFISPRYGQKVVALLPIALLLGHSHSAQNPLLYCVMHRNFRRAMQAALRCRTLSSRELGRVDSTAMQRRRFLPRGTDARTTVTARHNTYGQTKHSPWGSFSVAEHQQGVHGKTCSRWHCTDTEEGATTRQ